MPYINLVELKVSYTTYSQNPTPKRLLNLFQEKEISKTLKQLPALFSNYLLELVDCHHHQLQKGPMDRAPKPLHETRLETAILIGGSSHSHCLWQIHTSARQILYRPQFKFSTSSELPAKWPPSSSDQKLVHEAHARPAASKPRAFCYVLAFTIFSYPN